MLRQGGRSGAPPARGPLRQEQGHSRLEPRGWLLAVPVARAAGPLPTPSTSQESLYPASRQEAPKLCSRRSNFKESGLPV